MTSSAAIKRVGAGVLRISDMVAARVQGRAAAVVLLPRGSSCRAALAIP